MKKGKLVSCLAFAAVVMFSAALLVWAAQPPPEEITIKSSLWPTLTKTPAQFNHKKHFQEYKIACNACHHTYTDGQNTWKEGDPVEKCEKCHTEATVQGEMKLPPDQKKLNLKLAFHNNCLGCHKKLKAKNPESKAPITCTGCHPGAKE